MLAPRAQSKLLLAPALHAVLVDVKLAESEGLQCRAAASAWQELQLAERRLVFECYITRSMTQAAASLSSACWTCYCESESVGMQCRAAASAWEELQLAERRLGLCVNATSTGAQRKLLSAPALQLGSQLQEAYRHLWKLQLTEGWLKLKVCCKTSLPVITSMHVLLIAFTYNLWNSWIDTLC